MRHVWGVIIKKWHIYLHYTLHTIARRLGLAMGLTNAKWSGNIYKWKREYPLVTKVTDNNKYW
jgi:hypothetical protein